MTSRRGPAIIVVSGLPRSGTSMAMRMLEAGGMALVADGLRAADDDNPRGYFEFEPVKHLHTHSHAEADLAWLASARGKAVKIVSFLLTWLPETYDYRVVFMHRDLTEVVASQETMLVRRGESASGSSKREAETITIYEEHLAQVERFLARRACFTTLGVDYAAVLANPRDEAARIGEFLGGRLDVAAMAAAVEPTLRRQRPAAGPR
jgi:hypothetical protein